MTVTTSYSPNNGLLGAVAILTSLHGRELGLDVNRGLVIKADPTGVKFTATPSTANICLVTCQLIDNEGFAVAVAAEIEIWLSDAATGLGITGTTASGAVAAGATGTDLAVLVTKKMIRAQTDVNGSYTLSITDTAKTAFYVAIKLTKHNKARVSAVLATANFG